MGLSYNSAIDMWSLACVCAEMYLGLPLFPGVSQHNQLSRITEMLGMPPDFLIEGKKGLKYFTLNKQDQSNKDEFDRNNEKKNDTNISINESKYRLKTAEEFAFESNTEVPELRKYLRYSKLDDVIMKCPYNSKTKLSPDQKQMESDKRKSFLDFLNGLFNLNPIERWTAKQAASHPFITNSKLVVPFVPPSDPKSKEKKFLYIELLQKNKPQPLVNTTTTSLKQSIPTNFSNNPNSNDQDNFIPLQYSHRRQSEPADRSKINKLISESSGGDFGEANRPRLKRGNPVHARQPTSEQQSGHDRKISGDQHQKQHHMNNNNNNNNNSNNNYNNQAPVYNAPMQIPQYYSNNNMGIPPPSSNNQGMYQFNSYGSQQMHYVVPNFPSDNMNSNYNPNIIPNPGIPQEGGWIHPNNMIALQNGIVMSNTGLPAMAYSLPANMNNAAMMHNNIPIYAANSNIPSNIMYQQSPPNMNVPINQGIPMQYNSSMPQNVQYISHSMGSSLGVFGPGGSLVEGPVVMTDFGLALMRPDMDEQRRLLSQTQNHWYPSSYGNAYSPQSNNMMYPNPPPLNQMQRYQHNVSLSRSFDPKLGGGMDNYKQRSQ